MSANNSDLGEPSAARTVLAPADSRDPDTPAENDPTPESHRTPGSDQRKDSPWSAIGRKQWVSIGAMSSFILLLNLIGWGTVIVMSSQTPDPVVTTSVLGIGFGITAFTLGLRHAFDADHIAAIDSTTRKLMADGQKPVSVGFWFSLGHSSFVFGISLLLVLGIRTLAADVENADSALQSTLGVIGTSVSGVFLLLIGTINLFILIRMVRSFRQLRAGTRADLDASAAATGGGIIGRVVGRVTGSITKPWQMYAVGLLFGLGFDTASEVALLVLAAGAAASTLPWYAVLSLPILFAAGMSMLDTADGVFMNFAYGWAFSHPIRKIYYNLTVTALSVFVALAIGGIEIIGLIAEKLGADSGVLGWLGSMDLNSIGFIIVGVFVAMWVISILIYKLARVEEKWTRTAEATIS